MKLRTLTVISLLILVGLFAFQAPVRSDRMSTMSQASVVSTDETEPYYSAFALDETQEIVYAFDDMNDEFHVIDLTNYSVRDVFAQDINGRRFALSPDGTQLAVSSYRTNTIRVFDTTTLQQQTVFTVSVDYYYHVGEVTYLTNDRLIVVPYDIDEPRPILLYDLDDLSVVAETLELYDSYSRAFLTPDRTEMYAINAGERIHRYQVSTDGFTLLAMNPQTTEYSGYNACLMPELDMIYTGNGQVWSSDLSTLEGTFDNASCGFIACAVGQNRFLLAGNGQACADTVLGYDASTLEEIYRIPLNSAYHPMAMRSDGAKVVIGAVDHILYYGTDWQTRAYLPLSLKNECQPAFYDDFSDIAASFWPEYEDDYMRVGIVDGEYQIYTKNKDYWYSVYAPTCDREHYQVDVDVRWGQTPGVLYGLLFGMTEDRSQYYLFAIESDSRYVHLLYRTPAGFEPVESSFEFDAIQRFSANNHLTVRYYGSRVEVYVNGQSYFSGWNKNAADPGGFTGTALMTMSYPTTNISDARFDNFTVRELNASGVAVASLESSTACMQPTDLVHMLPVPVELLP